MMDARCGRGLFGSFWETIDLVPDFLLQSNMSVRNKLSKIKCLHCTQTDTAGQASSGTRAVMGDPILSHLLFHSSAMPDGAS